MDKTKAFQVPSSKEGDRTLLHSVSLNIKLMKSYLTNAMFMA